MAHTQKKSFVQMKMSKMNLDNTKKSESIAILQEDLEELLIVFAIKDTNYLKKFRYYFIAVHNI